MANKTQDSATASPRLPKVPEVAAATGMSTRKIHELVACGEPPGIRIGRSVRVDIRDLEDVLAANKSA